MGLILAGITLIGAISIPLILLSSIKEIRPNQRGLKERLGKYHSYCEAGWHIAFPIIEKLITVDITETMADAKRQEVITEDNLNCYVDAQIYYKVRPTEDGVKASQYNVQDYEYQIVQLARTTLRNIIGTLTLKEVNNQRDRINSELMKTLKLETKDWGIDVVRAELKEIEPPKPVQITMNQIVMAENKKIANKDLAEAAEIEADGKKKASIKEAEGLKQARVLKAEGEALSIKLVNEAANKYFVGNAQLLERLNVARSSLANNTKIIVSEGSDLVNVIGDSMGVVPVVGKKKGKGVV